MLIDIYHKYDIIFQQSNIHFLMHRVRTYEYILILLGSPMMVDKLQKSLNKKDFEQAKFHAHSLKGVCGNIGADQ